MKFIYATDLHGDTEKYETIIDYAIDNEISLIHLGADILPKGRNISEMQREFVNGYLRGFIRRCEIKGIKVLTMFGNDDLYIFKDVFKKYSPLLDESPELIGDTLFTGYPFVTDYPFMLVTACKYDYEGWKPQTYSGSKCDFVDGVLTTIKDPKSYFRDKGTIKDDMDRMVVPTNSVVAFHCPPLGVGLDVCHSRGNHDIEVILGLKKAPKPTKINVGSRAILEWIERIQPRLVLCGHIHESPLITGTWMAKIGRTVVIQPGQIESGTSVVVITLGETDTYEKMVL